MMALEQHKIDYVAQILGTVHTTFLIFASEIA